ncbi:MAG: Uma2 family endonuclease [Saprospiraceae bacterium]
MTGIAERKMTWKEFLELEIGDNDLHIYELINGIPVKRSAPFLRHQIASGNLFTYMNVYIKEKKLGRLFSAPVDVYIDDNNGYQPDIAFVSNERSFLIEGGEFITGVPDIVVEIISPGSIKRDRIDKKENYERYAVKELWFVDPQNQTVEIYVMKEDSFALHEFQEKDGLVKSVVLAGFEIDIKNIFE